eukprot:m.222706 g.222706  ORF g.222706 m.222706 type:complete len:727 (+) comp10813_c0_seq1:75-2255(+)
MESPGTSASPPSSRTWDHSPNVVARECAWIHRATLPDERGLKKFSLPLFLSELLLENQGAVARWFLENDSSISDYIPALTYTISSNSESCIPFLQSLIRTEVQQTKGQHFVFTSNSSIVALLIHYCRLCAQPFLEKTIGPLLTKLVRHVKEARKELKPKIIKELCKDLFADMRKHFNLLCGEIRTLLWTIFTEVNAKFPDHGHDVVSSFFCFRLLCSTVTTHPVDVPGGPSSIYHRAITVIGKVIQYAAASKPPANLDKEYADLLKLHSSQMRECFIHLLNAPTVFVPSRPSFYGMLLSTSSHAGRSCVPPCTCFAPMSHGETHELLTRHALRITELLSTMTDKIQLLPTPIAIGHQEAAISIVIRGQLCGDLASSVDEVLTRNNFRALVWLCDLPEHQSKTFVSDVMLLMMSRGNGLPFLRELNMRLCQQTNCPCCCLFDRNQFSFIGFQLVMQYCLRICDSWLDGVFSPIQTRSFEVVDPTQLATLALQGLFTSTMPTNVAIALRGLTSLVPVAFASKFLSKVLVQAIQSYYAAFCKSASMDASRIIVVGVLRAVLVEPSPTAPKQLVEAFAQQAIHLRQSILSTFGNETTIAEIEASKVRCDATANRDAICASLETLLLKSSLPSAPPHTFGPPEPMLITDPHVGKMEFAIRAGESLSRNSSGTSSMTASMAGRSRGLNPASLLVDHDGLTTSALCDFRDGRLFVPCPLTSTNAPAVDRITDV